ncbi:hypothetical protein J6590_008895 [Homalodisca vitripennis]|nr:hypothetical protein J6590_008895 [Homalodisca vitripennis]
MSGSHERESRKPNPRRQNGFTRATKRQRNVGKLIGHGSEIAGPFQTTTQQTPKVTNPGPLHALGNGIGHSACKLHCSPIVYNFTSVTYEEQRFVDDRACKACGMCETGLTSVLNHMRAGATIANNRLHQQIAAGSGKMYTCGNIERFRGAANRSPILTEAPLFLKYECRCRLTDNQCEPSNTPPKNYVAGAATTAVDSNLEVVAVFATVTPASCVWLRSPRSQLKRVRTDRRD